MDQLVTFPAPLDINSTGPRLLGAKLEEYGVRMWAQSAAVVCNSVQLYGKGMERQKMLKMTLKMVNLSILLRKKPSNCFLSSNSLGNYLVWDNLTLHVIWCYEIGCYGSINFTGHWFTSLNCSQIIFWMSHEASWPKKTKKALSRLACVTGTWKARAYNINGSYRKQTMCRVRRSEEIK